MIDHEKLTVYSLTLSFIAETRPLRARIPKGNADLIDQFKRASTSIALNIAEGAGKFGILDKQRFYAIARGSAAECAAILDLLVVFEFTDPDSIIQAKGKIERVIGMLTKLSMNKTPAPNAR